MQMSQMQALGEKLDTPDFLCGCWLLFVWVVQARVESAQKKGPSSKGPFGKDIMIC
jgi:hypothetical protein